MALIFTIHAQRDLEEAALWYEHQQTGLGKEFLAAIDEACSSIASNPQTFAEHKYGYRRVLTKRFPFGVIYKIDGETTIVMAVWHFSRRPFSWRRRK